MSENDKSMENQETDNSNIDTGEGENYLGEWKTRAEAEKGLSELNQLRAKQADEVGKARQQYEATQKELEALKANASKEQKTTAKNESMNELAKAKAEVWDKIDNLDPLDDGFKAEHGKLLRQLMTITEKEQNEKTLAAASDIFKSELSERDQQRALDMFFSENPDFQNPEMQTRIEQYKVADKTGLTGDLAAYRSIQRDDALAQLQQAQKENEDLKTRLGVKEGAEQTGETITKGQTTQVKPPPKTKLTGTDLDNAMAEAIRNAHAGG